MTTNTTPKRSRGRPAEPTTTSTLTVAIDEELHQRYTKIQQELEAMLGFKLTHRQTLQHIIRHYESTRSEL